MKPFNLRIALVLLGLCVFAAPAVFAQNATQTLPILAIGTLDATRAGSEADLSGLHYALENGVPANYLGGFGSAICYAGGHTFLALPDRGPNAVEFDDAIDNTASYINRFHTIHMKLVPNTSGAGYPFTLTPEMRATTLLWSPTPLVYGSGSGLGVGSGVPPINWLFFHFFTGRSDNFDPHHNSGDAADARLDSEGMRLSNDGRRVYISDEYGPYVYEFDRLTGARLRSFAMPTDFYVPNLFPVGNTEISMNVVGRTANKGMEGLAITPDGRTLVGIMQNSLIQDANEGGAAAKLLRIVTIDIASGKVTHQYAYLLTNGTGVSEIVALNNTEFLVDERDGHGRANGDKAKVKQLFKINLAGATDVSGMDGTTAATYAVNKVLFLDIVKTLTTLPVDPVAAGNIPAKIEGVAFGPDVELNGTAMHTLWIANDNDFLATVDDGSGNQIPNPNQFFVFGFTDADLAGSKFILQELHETLFPW